MSGRQELYEKLEKMMDSPSRSQHEVKTIIECLQSRTGAYGHQRKDLINNLFKGIVDLSFPQFVKYLFWGATYNLGLFSSQGELQNNLEHGVQEGDSRKQTGAVDQEMIFSQYSGYPSQAPGDSASARQRYQAHKQSISLTQEQIE